MEQVNFCLDADSAEFVNLDWKAPDSINELKNMHTLSEALMKLANNEEIVSNKKLSSNIDLLGRLCSMMMDSDNTRVPYKPLVVWGNGNSSYCLDEIDLNHLNVIQETIPRTTSIFLKARLYDLLWLKKSSKNKSDAENAILFYLDIGKDIRLNKKLKVLDAKDGFKRALVLAHQIKDDSLINAIYSEIKECLFLNDVEPENHTRCILFKLYSTGIGQEDFEYWVEFIDKILEDCLLEKDYHKARSYHDAMISLSNRLKLSSESLAYQKRKAHLYIDEARHFKGAGAEGLLLQQLYTIAIEECRNVKGMSIFVPELIKELTDAQSEIANELKEISTTINLEPLVAHLEEEIKDIDILPALEKIVECARPDKKSELLKSGLNQAKEFPLQALFATSIVDSKGKMIGRRAGRPSSDEEHLNYQMERACNYMLMSLPIKSTMVSIGLSKLKERSDFSEKILEEVLRPNPFIPINQIYQFRTGLQAGLREDWATAGFILIPLLENSFRNILERTGYRTIKVSSDGIQEEVDLNQYLWSPEFQKLVGENWAFHLQVLLIRRDGLNLRNQVAHGLLTDDSAFGHGMVVIWANVLHLCILYQRLYIKEQNKEE